MVGKFTLTCSGYNCTCSPAIQLYKGDSMILEFSITNKIISSIKGFEKVVYLPVSAAKAKLLIETPDGIDYQESVSTDNDVIGFKIPDTYTSQVGTYRMQIVLYDTNEDGSKCIVHLPEFTYEIKEPIGDVEILSSLKRKHFSLDEE